jgi:RNA polymerase sigma-70 factor (ECF subfamily)
MGLALAQMGTMHATRLDDPDRFARFFDRTLPRVYGYFIARTGGDVTIAEDLTQETFLSAVAAVRKKPEIGDAERWLFGIARHRLIDHYRATARDSANTCSWDDREPLGGDLDLPALRLHDQQVCDQVIESLYLLPPAQRAALVLHYLDGLPVCEVAEFLGRSEHATESLLARGRRGFKTHFQRIARENTDGQ